jgi:hypothetical protein
VSCSHIQIKLCSHSQQQQQQQQQAAATTGPFNSVAGCQLH